MKNNLKDAISAIVIAIIILIIAIIFLDLLFPVEEVNAQEGIVSTGSIVMAEDGEEKIRISSDDFRTLKDEVDSLFIELDDSIEDSGLVH